MNVPQLDTWVRLDRCHTSQARNGEPVEEWEEGEPECVAYIQPAVGRVVNNADNEQQQVSFLVISRYSGRLEINNAPLFRMVDIETGLIYSISNPSYIQGRKHYVQFTATFKTQLQRTNGD